MYNNRLSTVLALLASASLAVVLNSENMIYVEPLLFMAAQTETENEATLANATETMLEVEAEASGEDLT